MKNIKFLMLLVAAVSVAFTSCNETDWTPGEPDSATSVYLTSGDQDYTVALGTTSIELPVFRNTAGEAVSVDLRVADESGLFNVPTSVSFAAGEIESSFVITFNTDDMEPGKKYPIAIQVKNEENRGAYGPADLNITIGIPEPWNSLGMGIYRDDLYCNIVDGLDPGYMAWIEFQQHAVETERIRVAGLFSKEMTASYLGGLPQWMNWLDNEVALEFNLSDPELVTIVGDSNDVFDGAPAIKTGFQLNMGDGLVDMYLVQQVGGLYDEAAGIISFPSTANSFLLISQDWYGMYVNTSGMLAFAFPGAEFTDTSISATYGGMKVSADNTEVKAIVDFTLGYDVESYKFAVLSGEVDVEATAAGIIDGTLEGVIASDAETTSWEVDAEPGIITVVAVTFIGEEAKTTYSTSFYFAGLGTTEVPEAEITCEVGSVYSFTGNADHISGYPANSTLAIFFTAKAEEVKSISYFVGAGVPADVDDWTILAQGKDASSFIDNLAATADPETGYGYGIMVFQGLSAGMTIDVVLGFDTIYGKKSFRMQYTVPSELDEAPATGEEEATTSAKVLSVAPFQGDRVCEPARELTLRTPVQIM